MCDPPQHYKTPIGTAVGTYTFLRASRKTCALDSHRDDSGFRRGSCVRCSIMSSDVTLVSDIVGQGLVQSRVEEACRLLRGSFPNVPDVPGEGPVAKAHC